MAICSKFYGGGGGNKSQAEFTHPLCRKNPDPYFHRGCGTNACLYYNMKIALGIVGSRSRSCWEFEMVGSLHVYIKQSHGCSSDKSLYKIYEYNNA